MKEELEMRTLIVLALFAACASLSGCAYHPAPVTVYGATGKQYIAPDLCAAVVACKLSNEATCYSVVQSLTYPDGLVTDNSCKAAK